MKPPPHTETDVLAVRPLCDICRDQGKRVPASVDCRLRGRTTWAYLCRLCFGCYGAGLGLGVGQLLIVDDDEERPLA